MNADSVCVHLSKTRDNNLFMTKRHLAWLLIRIAGTCLLFNSLRFLFIILENVLLASSSFDGKIVLSQGSGLIAGWAIEAGIYFIIGIYLLLDGKRLFDLWDREPPEAVPAVDEGPTDSA
jgi:hypothetical protein